MGQEFTRANDRLGEVLRIWNPVVAASGALPLAIVQGNGQGVLGYRAQANEILREGP